MDFSIKAFDTKNTLTAAKTGCVAVAVFENKKLSQAAKPSIKPVKSRRR
jgi:leucyl aminopeptidase